MELCTHENAVSFFLSKYSWCGSWPHDTLLYVLICTWMQRHITRNYYFLWGSLTFMVVQQTSIGLLQILSDRLGYDIKID